MSYSPVFMLTSSDISRRLSAQKNKNKKDTEGSKGLTRFTIDVCNFL